MPLQYPLVNGHRKDFSSIELTIAGVNFIGFKAINYSHGMTPQKVRGAHPQALGRTRGEYDADGDATLLHQEWNVLKALLGPGYLEREFDVVVSYADDNEPIVVDRLSACRILKVNHNNQQGTDAVEVRLELSVMLVLENNVAPVIKPLIGAI